VNGEAGVGGLGVCTRERIASPLGDGGRLLLILASRDVQSVAELAIAAGRSSMDTLRSLGRLVDQGFLIVGDPNGTAVYQLRPKSDRFGVADLPEHILLIEDDALISEVVVEVLEDEGYAVVACLTPLHAMALLQRVSFDLVITDGFSRVPGAVVTSTADVIRSAGVTPVALFSAHLIDLGVAKAAGFRDLITKPFDLNTLVQQVKALLGYERDDDPFRPPAALAPGLLTVG
jgi:CheY-like chemotaxis protein